MSRYEITEEQVVQMVDAILVHEFPRLIDASICVLYDTKKRMSNGSIVVAKIKKMNDELSFFTKEYAGKEFDYVIYIDKDVWNALEVVDRQRVIYHELCHIEIDYDKNNPYGLRDHEIQGFYDEAEYNSDDPKWSERVKVVAESVHDPENG